MMVAHYVHTSSGKGRKKVEVGRNSNAKKSVSKNLAIATTKWHKYLFKCAIENIDDMSFVPFNLAHNPQIHISSS
jgi:hypothetical protein